MAFLNQKVFADVLNSYMKEFNPENEPKCGLNRCKDKLNAVKIFDEKINNGEWSFGENKLKDTLNEINGTLKLAWIQNLNIEKLAQVEDNDLKEISKLFKELFDYRDMPFFEDLPFFHDDHPDTVQERIDAFVNGVEKYDISSFVAEWMATTFLWLYFPNDYYVYHSGQMKNLATILDDEYKSDEESSPSIREVYSLNNQMIEYIQNNQADFLEFYDKHISAEQECYCDQEHITLINDIVYFISTMNRDQNQIYVSWKNIKKEQPEPRCSVNKTVAEIKKIIENGGTQIVLNGAPGTGKTKSAKEVAKELGSAMYWMKNSPKYKLVQFHPSYDYTDFVEGLRPVEKEDENGELTFKKIDGVFKDFCRCVVKWGKPAGKYFFIIDEINRADLSKVFGELMVGLEKDKRGRANRFDTQYQNLQTYDSKTGENIREIFGEDCFENGFYIPENVIIIGTMNDIDRSVESMDFAMRRRFVWREIEVADVLKDALTDIFNDICLKINIKAVDSSKIESIVEQVKDLNDYIADEKNKVYGLSHNYDISQGQFTGLSDDVYRLLVEDSDGIKKFMEEVWNQRIEGLLEEYVRGEEETDKFIQDCKGIFVDGKIPPSNNKQK